MSEFNRIDLAREIKRIMDAGKGTIRVTGLREVANRLKSGIFPFASYEDFLKYAEAHTFTIEEFLEACTYSMGDEHTYFIDYKGENIASANSPWKAEMQAMSWARENGLIK